MRRALGIDDSIDFIETGEYGSYLSSTAISDRGLMAAY
jgi:hypothetical protein